jgi:beta-lactamase class A
VLNRELAGFKADTGVFVKNLKTGEQAGVRDDRAFNSFSVIKLGIMLRAFDLAAQDQLNPDQSIAISAPDLRDGSGILYTFDAGLRVTLRDLITQMVVTSDNTATDMLLTRVGGLEALNGWLCDKGFGETRMIQSTGDFFRQPLVLADSNTGRSPTNRCSATGLRHSRSTRSGRAAGRRRAPTCRRRCRSGRCWLASRRCGAPTRDTGWAA